MIQLTLEQFQALTTLAHQGTMVNGQVDVNKANNLNSFLKTIERANGITRDILWVQWTESDSPLPPTTRFPDVWPPTMRFFIEQITRKIAKTDVQKVLDAHAKKPVDVLVTRDPGARLGWTALDSFFL